MKKLFLILAMIGITAFSVAQDRTVNIRSGSTVTSWPMSFSAADSIAGKGAYHIVESDSIVILIVNPQKYMQNQVFTTTLAKASGTPAVTITLRGKVTATDNWHPIGTPVSWSTSANNPAVITSTAPVNYNWLKVSYVTDATDQCVKILTADIKTSNAYDIPVTAGTLTISRPTSGTVILTSKDNDANAALTVTPGGTGALTIGNGTGTAAVNSSDWDISTTGIMTGIGAITTDGTFDNIVVNAVAGGDKNINSSITQSATALTGNLIGAGIVATNGTSAAANGVIYGIEAKARAADASNAGNTIGRLDGVYASVDAKNKTATTMRAFEASLDGAAGGASTEAVAFEAFNNSSATQTSSYAFSANAGTASGHKAYTADLRLQNGETVSNATDGTVAVSGVSLLNPRFATIITNTDESETLTAAQSGALVTTDGAATITIPDPSAATVGVIYYIMQTADANLVLTCATATSNAFVCDGVATSDQITIDTGSHKIGAGMIVIGISATQWYVGGLNPESVLTPEATD